MTLLLMTYLNLGLSDGAEEDFRAAQTEQVSWAQTYSGANKLEALRPVRPDEDSVVCGVGGAESDNTSDSDNEFEEDWHSDNEVIPQQCDDERCEPLARARSHKYSCNVTVQENGTASTQYNSVK